MDRSIAPANFTHYTYSRKSHLPLLARYADELYDREVDFSLCDLKCYQDLLVFGFIRKNIPAGSKILEIGGGDSRVLEKLSQTYECWNIDKHEGLGNGPITARDRNRYRLIQDYIGGFNSDLQDDYFDFVFSISALEHTQADDEAVFNDILMDINRVLSPGCLSLHCFDLIMHEKLIWTNPLLPYLYNNAQPLNNLIPFSELLSDNDIYVMTKRAYDRCWRTITQKTYELFGRPFSCNILWCKQAEA